MLLGCNLPDLLWTFTLEQHESHPRFLCISCLRSHWLYWQPGVTSLNAHYTDLCTSVSLDEKHPLPVTELALNVGDIGSFCKSTASWSKRWSILFPWGGRRIFVYRRSPRTETYKVQLQKPHLLVAHPSTWSRNIRFPMAHSCCLWYEQGLAPLHAPFSFFLLFPSPMEYANVKTGNFEIGGNCVYCGRRI